MKLNECGENLDYNYIELSLIFILVQNSFYCLNNFLEFRFQESFSFISAVDNPITYHRQQTISQIHSKRKYLHCL